MARGSSGSCSTGSGGYGGEEEGERRGMRSEEGMRLDRRGNKSGGERKVGGLFSRLTYDTGCRSAVIIQLNCQ